jgi:hypothetical protein
VLEEHLNCSRGARLNAGDAEIEKGGDEVGRQALHGGSDDFQVFHVKTLRNKVNMPVSKGDGWEGGQLEAKEAGRGVCGSHVTPALPWRRRRPEARSKRGGMRERGLAQHIMSVMVLARGKCTRSASISPATPAAAGRQHCLL